MRRFSLFLTALLVLILVQPRAISPPGDQPAVAALDVAPDLVVPNVTPSDVLLSASGVTLFAVIAERTTADWTAHQALTSRAMNDVSALVDQSTGRRFNMGYPLRL